MKMRATIHWLGGAAGMLLLAAPALVWAPPGGLKVKLDACEADLEECLSTTYAVFPGDGQTGAPLAYEESVPPDGTFIDLNTGLMWEIKTGTVGDPIDCTIDPLVCAAGHDVNLRFDWSQTGDEPDGLVFTSHLMNLNHTCGGNGDPVSYCDDDDDCAGEPIRYCGLGGHMDWRLPTVKELQSLVDYSEHDPAVLKDTSNEVLLPGATAPAFYWSSTANASVDERAWFVVFTDGNVGDTFKVEAAHVRAVREGF